MVSVGSSGEREAGMTGLVVLHLDRDVAGHLAVALRRHRGDLQRRGYVEPPGLADLETLFLGVVKSDGTQGECLVRRFWMMRSMPANSSPAATSADRPGSVCPRSTSGSSQVSSRRPRTAESAVSPAGISTGSSGRQRDLRWLRSATPEQIDRALEAGELNYLLGQPTGETT